jgi:hypothetical protein
VLGVPGGAQRGGPLGPERGGDQAVEQAADLGGGQRDGPAVAGVVPGIGGRGRCRGGGACHEEGEGEHGQGDEPVPAGPGPDLVVVQPDLAFGGLELFFDGLITNGKFCCVRRLRLSLSWWHRPLRLRGCALQADVALVGEPDEPDVDRQTPADSAPRRRAPVGSGLPAVSALGRAGRSAGPGADPRGGA